MSARKAWLLGVCGMGMGPLAIYLRRSGWEVSGWDDAIQPPMNHFLKAAGVILKPQFDEMSPPEIAGFSSAVKPENPLCALAEKHGVRLVRRGKLLSEILAEKQLIAVCGSHGKTTTSGMLIQALLAAGEDIGYILGGLYRDTEMTPANAGNSPWAVAEVDESDGTINHFSPEITVAVNLDWDHPDYYKTERELEQVFADVFRRTRRAIFIPAGNERLERLAKMASVPFFTVGEDGDFSARVVSNDTAQTRLELGRGFTAGEISVPVLGRFNTANALMALAVTTFVSGKIGVTPLGKFSGIRRRQDVLFDDGGLRVMADYAHHPTEISALLNFLRESVVGRLVAVFQPHRHTRTRQYAREFANALSCADAVFLLPVYSAGEKFVEGGSTANVFAQANGDGKFLLIENDTALPAHLDAIARDGTDATVVFIGAGNIDKMAASFVRELWISGVRAGTETKDFGGRVMPFLGEETRLRENIPLAEKTTIRIGGAARWFAEPASLEDLRLLLRGVASGNLPFFILGRGSNLLVPDDGFPGVVISLSHAIWQQMTPLENGTFEVFAGASLKSFARFAAENGTAGFEFLEGIPGTLGGALRMNAGAFGARIFDRVKSVKWLSPDGELHERPREFFNDTYRDCPELRGAIILSATMNGTGEMAPEKIIETMRSLTEQRRVIQPKEPSAGCFFKNPPGNFAGALIEKAGLKGMSEGGAQVSPKHANFIINGANATAADIIALVKKVRGVVRAEQGMELEPEVTLLGREWREIL